jgi:uncharacterized membrane protein (DUF373 family)
VVVRSLERSLFTLEVAIAISLVVLVAVALTGIGIDVVSIVRAHRVSSEALSGLLDRAFTAFILIELLATAVASLQDRFVVRRLLEAALLAVSRKIVLLDLHADGLPVAIGVTLLLAGIAISWLVLQRAGAIRPLGDAKRRSRAEST